MKKMTTKEIKPVSAIDINAPLKAPIGESTEYETAVTSKNRFLYILGIAGFVGISLLACGVLIFYLVSFKGKSENKSVRVSVSENQNSITTSPAKTFDRRRMTIEVLNGSGVPGAAKKAADSVQGLGYRIVGTGNTGQVKGNKLYLKKDTAVYSSEIIADLADFNISTVSGELTEGTASARLILGTK